MPRNMHENHGENNQWRCPICQTPINDSMEALDAHRQENPDCDRHLTEAEKVMGLKRSMKYPRIANEIRVENLSLDLAPENAFGEAISLSEHRKKQRKKSGGTE